MKRKLPEIKANYKLWLSLKNGDGILGDGKWRLLTTIKETGSIVKASEKLGISYRKAWGDLRKAEELLAISIIDKQRGGADGGRTLLTDDGVKLINAYTKFHNNFNRSADRIFSKFISELKELK